MARQAEVVQERVQDPVCPRMIFQHRHGQGTRPTGTTTSV